jgi:hypothetical protein
MAGAGCAAVAIAATVAFPPTVAERWNIYTSSTGAPGDAYTQFLGPFPTRVSCDVEARIIVRGGGHAYCGRTVALELGRTENDLLWSEFWPSARWIALCKARFKRQPTSAAPVTLRSSPDASREAAPAIAITRN